MALNYRRNRHATRGRKRGIRVPLSRQESALASGRISLERSRSKSATGATREMGGGGGRKEGSREFSFRLTNFIASGKLSWLQSTLARLQWEEEKKSKLLSKGLYADLINVKTQRASRRRVGFCFGGLSSEIFAISFARIIAIQPVHEDFQRVACAARQRENAPFTRILARECR